MNDHGIIVQLNVSTGGVPKLPVEQARVAQLGIEGDGHNNTRHHGGPDRALCLFALERIEAIAAEGHPLRPGSAGENVTVRGLDWDQVVPGVRLRLGAEVLAEVTGYASPCATNKAWFIDGEFMRMSQELHPGWSRVYARVLAPGLLQPGDAVEIVPGA